MLRSLPPYHALLLSNSSIDFFTFAEGSQTLAAESRKFLIPFLNPLNSTKTERNLFRDVADESMVLAREMLQARTVIAKSPCASYPPPNSESLLPLPDIATGFASSSSFMTYQAAIASATSITEYLLFRKIPVTEKLEFLYVFDFAARSWRDSHSFVPFLSLLLSFYPYHMFVKMMNESFAFGLPKGPIFRLKFLRFLCDEWDPSPYISQGFAPNISAAIAFALMHFSSMLVSVRIAAFLIIRKVLRFVLLFVEEGKIGKKVGNSPEVEDGERVIGYVTTSTSFDRYSLLYAIWYFEQKKHTYLSADTFESLKIVTVSMMEAVAKALAPMCAYVVQWVSICVKALSVHLRSNRWIDDVGSTVVREEENEKTDEGKGVVVMEMESNDIPEYERYPELPAAFSAKAQYRSVLGETGGKVSPPGASLPRVFAEYDSPLLIAQFSMILLTPWIFVSNLGSWSRDARTEFLEMMIELMRDRLLITHGSLLESDSSNDENQDPTTDEPSSFYKLAKKEGGGSILSSVLKASARFVIINKQSLPLLPNLREAHHFSADVLLESFLVAWASLSFQVIESDPLVGSGKHLAPLTSATSFGSQLYLAWSQANHSKETILNKVDEKIKLPSVLISSNFPMVISLLVSYGIIHFLYYLFIFFFVCVLSYYFFCFYFYFFFYHKFLLVHRHCFHFGISWSIFFVFILIQHFKLFLCFFYLPLGKHYTDFNVPRRWR
jgi:hypothetical protein